MRNVLYVLVLLLQALAPVGALDACRTTPADECLLLGGDKLDATITYLFQNEIPFTQRGDNICVPVEFGQSLYDVAKGGKDFHPPEPIETIGIIIGVRPGDIDLGDRDLAQSIADLLAEEGVQAEVHADGTLEFDVADCLTVQKILDSPSLWWPYRRPDPNSSIQPPPASRPNAADK